MSASSTPVATAAPPLAVPFGPWEPDKASLDSSSALIAENVFPQATGYGPVPAPEAVTLALPAPARGSIAVRQQSGAWIFYVGTTTALYRFNPGTLGWDNVSGTSTYLLPDGDYWSFAPYGPLLIATHTGALPQTINIETGAKFADLAFTSPDPPPHARFVTVVNEFVFLAGILDNDAAVQWSAIGDPSYWTPGVNDSDIQILPDGGRVTGIIGSDDTAIVFQEQAIQEFIFAAGTGQVFQRQKVEADRGAVAPWSVIKIGANIFFLDRDGFYMFGANGSQPIGKERVNAWMKRLADPTYLQTAKTCSDPSGTRVLWAFKSQNASDPTALDQAIAYDYVLDRWSKVDVFVRDWLRAETQPLSFDNLSGNADTQTGTYDFLGGLSSDSALFTGGNPLVGIFGADDKLSLLEGPSLEAKVGTPWVQIGRPKRAYVDGVRIDTDASAWFVTVSTRESNALADPARARPETGPNVERFAPCRASGRYHQATVRIAAGDPWTFVQAAEPLSRAAEGMR